MIGEMHPVLGYDPTEATLSFDSLFWEVSNAVAIVCAACQSDPAPTDRSFTSHAFFHRSLAVPPAEALFRACTIPSAWNCGCRIVKNLSTMACTDPAQQLSGQGAAQAGTAQQAPTEELPASQSAEGIARQVLHSSRIQIAVD